jgi:hydrogenase/urease accessory protein HupE
MIRGLALWLILLLGVVPPALAHEIRPAFLQVREIEPATYDILWKTPAQGDMRLALNVILPQSCARISEPRATLAEGAVIERWRVRCEGGLVGQELAIGNLSQTLTDTIVRYEPLQGSNATLRLTPAEPRATIPARQQWTDVAAGYFRLGVEHILLGFDHLMFVLALLLLVRDPRRIVLAVTAFTVAHSLTLAGTTFGWVSLASAPVEAAIALSIMFIAMEIMRARAGQESFTARLPWLVSFAFGLLHGFGFAGALRETGIPQDAAPLALLFFNLGVEGGQLVFILGILALRWLARRLSQRPPAWAWQTPVYLIGGVSAFWFIERTAGIFGL